MAESERFYVVLQRSTQPGTGLAMWLLVTIALHNNHVYLMKIKDGEWHHDAE
jgi:hypothetical protein